MSLDAVALCVCTFRRPTMLARCLASLGQQVVDASLRVEIIVVDNELDPNNRAAVTAFAERCPFPVEYVHQPARGIAAARNAAVERALSHGADWVAFIDDDATAAPDWVAALMSPTYRSVPVLAGRRIAVPPDPPPFWCVPGARWIDTGPEGRREWTTATANVRFSTALLHAGLRFDESIGLGGGEDIRFFARAHAAGFEIRSTCTAVTYEVLHPERMTLGALVYRDYWGGASDVVAMLEWRTRARTLAVVIAELAITPVIGVALIVIGPLALCLGVDAFKRCVVEGSRRLARTTGRGAGLFGIAPQPYRRVVEH